MTELALDKQSILSLTLKSLIDCIIKYSNHFSHKFNHRSELRQISRKKNTSSVRGGTEG